MTRKVARLLACLALASAAGLVGCTWAETQHDFPRSMDQQADGHDHDHGHQH